MQSLDQYPRLPGETDGMGCWSKTSPHAVFYQGNPDEHVYFRDNVFRGGLEPNHPLLQF